MINRHCGVGDWRYMTATSKKRKPTPWNSWDWRSRLGGSASLTPMLRLIVSGKYLQLRKIIIFQEVLFQLIKDDHISIGHSYCRHSVNLVIDLFMLDNFGIGWYATYLCNGMQFNYIWNYEKKCQKFHEYFDAKLHWHCFSKGWRLEQCRQLSK